MRINSVRGATGCPDCASSKNEKRVGFFLKTNNIEYDKQYHIQLPNRRCLADFFISKLNLIIEYNGAQHYMPVCFGHTNMCVAQENFKRQQLRDEELREYCITKNINLLEIDGRIYKGIYLDQFLTNYFK